MRGVVTGFGILGVIGLCVLHAQSNRSPLAAEAAAARAWSLLTTSLSAADLREQLAAVSALTIADTRRPRSDRECRPERHRACSANRDLVRAIEFAL